MMKAARRSNPTTKVSASQSPTCLVDSHRPGFRLRQPFPPKFLCARHEMTYETIKIRRSGGSCVIGG
jgi:hypothetical protein